MKLFKRKKEVFNIIDRSNTIQYDDMGYPLRLCIVDIGEKNFKQMWLDTTQKEDDIVLKWENKKENN